MKKGLFALILLVAALLLAAVPAQAGDLLDRAAAQLAKEAVRSLPGLSGVTRIAIADIKDDRGVLFNALSAAVQADPRFVLVERKRLQQIVKEQGLQVSDLINRRDRVKFGQIRGVQAILFADGFRQHTGILQVEAAAHISLISVQTGKVVLAKSYTGLAVWPYKNQAILAAAALAAILLAAWRLRARSRRKIHKMEGTGVEQRGRLLSLLDGASGDIKQAEGKFAGEEFSEVALALRKARMDMDALRNMLQAARYGSADKGDLKGLARFDKAFDHELGDLKHLTERLRREAGGGSQRGTMNVLGHINERLADLNNRLASRS
ncbi:MAG: CsgG/HfaB family protein [Thermodesulfobacteriota bacterium]